MSKWTDGPYNIATPVSQAVFSSPIPGVKDELVLTQKWQMTRASYDSVGPASVGTAHPTYSSFKLMSEGPREEVPGGVVEFERTYAKRPAEHIEPEDYVYSFIGYTQSIGGGGYQTTPRRNLKVRSRVYYDYFVADGTSQTDSLLGGTPTITTDGDIPVALAMAYVSQGSVGGATFGGLSMPVDFLNLQGTVLPTWPTADQYLAMIADALTNKWAATKSKVVAFASSTLLGGPPPTSGHAAGVIDAGSSVQGGLIPVETSSVERWMGNIFVRKTRYVLAYNE
jgi:hypothetical protein